MSQATVECPACPTELGPQSSLTCSRCGLWWVQGDRHERWTAPKGIPLEPSPRLRLRVAEPFPFGCALALLTLVVVGWGVAWTLPSSLGDVPSFGGWGVLALPFGLLVSLPLGVLVGTWSAAVLARAGLGLLVPSRLDGDSTALRLRVWKTWRGLASGFVRTQATIPRERILGVAFGRGQGGHSQLFLVHQSGYHFYAGFTGDRQRLEELGISIEQWLGRGRPLTESPSPPTPDSCR